MAKMILTFIIQLICTVAFAGESLVQQAGDVLAVTQPVIAQAVTSSPGLILNRELSEGVAQQTRAMSNWRFLASKTADCGDAPDSSTSANSRGLPELVFVDAFDQNEVGAARANLGSKKLSDLIAQARAGGNLRCEPKDLSQLLPLRQPGNDQARILNSELSVALATTQRLLFEKCGVAAPFESIAAQVFLLRWQYRSQNLSRDFQYVRERFELNDRLAFADELTTSAIAAPGLSRLPSREKSKALAYILSQVAVSGEQVSIVGMDQTSASERLVLFKTTESLPDGQRRSAFAVFSDGGAELAPLASLRSFQPSGEGGLVNSDVAIAQNFLRMRAEARSTELRGMESNCPSADGRGCSLRVGDTGAQRFVVAASNPTPQPVSSIRTKKNASTGVQGVDAGSFFNDSGNESNSVSLLEMGGDGSPTLSMLSRYTAPEPERQSSAEGYLNYDQAPGLRSAPLFSRRGEETERRDLAVRTNLRIDMQPTDTQIAQLGIRTRVQRVTEGSRTTTRMEQQASAVYAGPSAGVGARIVYVNDSSSTREDGLVTSSESRRSQVRTAIEGRFASGNLFEQGQNQSSARTGIELRSTLETSGRDSYSRSRNGGLSSSNESRGVSQTELTTSARFRYQTSDFSVNLGGARIQSQQSGDSSRETLANADATLSIAGGAQSLRATATNRSTQASGEGLRESEYGLSWEGERFSLSAEREQNQSSYSQSTETRLTAQTNRSVGSDQINIRAQYQLLEGESGKGSGESGRALDVRGVYVAGSGTDILEYVDPGSRVDARSRGNRYTAGYVDSEGSFRAGGQLSYERGVNGLSSSVYVTTAATYEANGHRIVGDYVKTVAGPSQGRDRYRIRYENEDVFGPDAFVTVGRENGGSVMRVGLRKKICSARLRSCS